MSTIDSIAVFHEHSNSRSSSNDTPSSSSSFCKFSPFFVKFNYKSKTETKVHVFFAKDKNEKEWNYLTSMVLLPKQSVPIFSKQNCSETIQCFDSWKCKFVDWMDRNSFKPHYSMFSPNEQESLQMTQRLEQQHLSGNSKFVYLKFEAEESMLYSNNSSSIDGDIPTPSPSTLFDYSALYQDVASTTEPSSPCFPKQTKKKKQIAMGRLYLFDCKDKLVISDIDGTITCDDLGGHISQILKNYNYCHKGICSVYQQLQQKGLKFLYLTARPMSSSKATRDYLEAICQESSKLPEGPILMAFNSPLSAIVREVLLKNPHHFKIRILKHISTLFNCDQNSSCASTPSTPLSSTLSAQTQFTTSNPPFINYTTNPPVPSQSYLSHRRGSLPNAALPLHAHHSTTKGAQQKWKKDLSIQTTSTMHKVSSTTTLTEQTPISATSSTTTTTSAFSTEGYSPYVLGFGNRPTDCLAYASVGVSPNRSLRVNTKSMISILATKQTFDDFATLQKALDDLL